MTTTIDEKLQELESVENDIGKCLTSASSCLTELSKDKPSSKQVENHATEFLNTVKLVENRLLGHINYLSQMGVGSAHEGSSYSATRDQQAAVNRLDYIHDQIVQQIIPDSTPS